MTPRIAAAIVGSGNIGTDLLIKLLRARDSPLEPIILAGIDAGSEGLARARRLGVATTSTGVDGMLRMPDFEAVKVIFDATSAAAHTQNWALLEPTGRRVVDLTPAALGPFVVPAVNLDSLANHQNVNMVTCGGQATVPIVAAVSRITDVLYAEIVASISSLSAGPGTRANIDEFTVTTARAIESVGRAQRGKAIIILNPADPPLVMRDTVEIITAVIDDTVRNAINAAIQQMVAVVATYVPGYRLKQNVQFRDIGREEAGSLIGAAGQAGYTRISVFLEVEGAGHYLPRYAGNLDIMTAAAAKTGAIIGVAAGELG